MSSPWDQTHTWNAHSMPVGLLVLFHSMNIFLRVHPICQCYMNLNQKLCPGVHSRPHKGPSQLWSFKEHHTSSGGSEGLGYIWSDVKISDCILLRCRGFSIKFSCGVICSSETLSWKCRHKTPSSIRSSRTETGQLEGKSEKLWASVAHGWMGLCSWWETFIHLIK